MGTGQAADGGVKNGVLERPAIEQFAMDYEMPMTVANCLVGRNEAETEMNMKMMVEYLESIHQKNTIGDFVLLSPERKP